MKYAIFVMVVMSELSLGATYYVSTSGNDTTGVGTIDKPWQTIQYSVNQLQPGDTLSVRGGRYREYVNIGVSGTLQNPINIVEYSGEKAVLDGSEPITGWTKCQSNDPYMTVQGVLNPHYQNIYWTKVHKDRLPSDIFTMQLFENTIHSRRSRWPDQTLGYGIDISEFREVPAASNGLRTNLVDQEQFDPTNTNSYWYSCINGLTEQQISNYFAGTRIAIHMKNANANIVNRTILSAAKVTDKSYYQLKFDTLGYDIVSTETHQDRYSVINHPHALNSAGEFWHSLTSDAEGYYYIYYWPIDTGNLAEKITIPAKTTGFRIYRKNYLNIDGFDIVGYRSVGIYGEGQSSAYNTGIYLKNCTVEDVGSHGIYLVYAKDTTVDSCHIYRAEGRGIFLNAGSHCTIKNSSGTDTTSTNLSFYAIKNGKMIRNTVNGMIGSHGNGISCYQGCEDILLAYNYGPSTNLALQDIKNVIVYANIFDYEEEDSTIISTWGDTGSAPASSGYAVYAHNVLLGSIKNSSLSTKAASSWVATLSGLPREYKIGELRRPAGTLPLSRSIYRCTQAHTADAGINQIEAGSDWESYWTLDVAGEPVSSYIINNILDGYGTWYSTKEISHNFYTGLENSQASRYGWQLEEGGIIGTGTPLTTLFVGPSKDKGADYSLAANSPVIGKGAAIQKLLDSLGVKGAHPDFDFTKDWAGKSWAETPSIGAFEQDSTIPIPTSYSLNLTIVSGNGGVTKTVNGTVTTATSFPAGTEVKLTAAANAGYTFGSWTGDTAGTTATATVIMNGNKSVTANFTAIAYTLTITAANGTVAKSPSKATYAYGETVTLTATANAGYTFGSWTGDAAGTTATATVIMNGNKSVTANFTAFAYTLTITAANGTVAKSPSKATYANGEVVTLTAAANPGYSFSSWTGSVTGTTTTATVTMNGNKSVTANFTAIAYTLTTTATNGTVTKSPSKATYTYGEVVTLTAVANAGYGFGSWTGSITGTTTTATVTMNGNKVVTANFAALAYTLTTTATNGTVTKSPNKTTYAYGEVITLTAAPNAGYGFGSWTGSVTGTTTTATVTMNSNKAVAANFEPISTDNSPVAHWLLNELYQTTAVDIISGLSATLINDPTWGDGWKQGEEDFVRMGTGTQALQIPMSKCNPQSGTIALWVQPDDDSGTHFLFGHTFNSANRIALYTIEGNLALGLGNTIALRDSITPLSPGQPYHIALTWDGTDYAVFVDGTQKATGTFSGLTQLNSFADVGNYGIPENRSNGLGFRGRINDIQLYSQAINTDDIQSLFLTHYIKEGSPVVFIVSGTAPYTAENLPQGAVFDFQTQTFSWKPGLYNTAGQYPITFTAAGQPTQTVTVSVQDVALAEWYQGFLVRLGK